MYVLLSFNSDTREFAIAKHRSHKDAWENMKKELLEAHGAEFAEDYEKSADADGFVYNADGYGIDEDYAWANCGNGMNCDWAIREIAPGIPPD